MRTMTMTWCWRTWGRACWRERVLWVWLVWLGVSVCRPVLVRVWVPLNDDLVLEDVGEGVLA